MIQRRKDWIGAAQPAQQDWIKDYRRGDIEVLFSRGSWRNWDEAINWLERYGGSDNELTPGEAVAMKEDLTRLKLEGTAFSRDPVEVFKRAHKFRQKNNLRERGRYGRNFG